MYAQSERSIVVDVDLEKFFDSVNHDILMDRLGNAPGGRRVVADPSVPGCRNPVRWRGAEAVSGTLQGGPLSPLLANVLLDEVDWELQRRGHCFVRYADDCNVYVRSRKAGDRVMAPLRRCYARLMVNETKRAVALGWKAYFGLAQTPQVWRELDECCVTDCGRSSSSTEARYDDVS